MDLTVQKKETAHEPSKSFSIIPIMKAFKKAEKNLRGIKEGQKWIGANDEAKEILAFVEKFRENDELNHREMEALLSDNVAEVNSFLMNNGFDWRIKQLIAGSTFLVAV